MMYHIPVLFDESIGFLITDPAGSYADLTFGGGGHAKGILEKLHPQGKLWAFDQDEDAFANQLHDSRFQLIRSNFRFFENFLTLHQAVPIHGILADLGVSSHQFDEAKRGFSFRFDVELDMRMDRSSGINAADILNTYSPEKLSDIFFMYGEIRHNKSLVNRILEFRSRKPIHTTSDFSEVMKGLWPKKVEVDLLPQIYQALRIEVNDEMKALETMLQSSARVLRPGGRLVVISYHSLEDRMVKHFMRSGNFEDKVETDLFGRVKTPWKLIKSGAVKPSDEEIKRNPRARSARMRIAERIE